MSKIHLPKRPSLILFFALATTAIIAASWYYILSLSRQVAAVQFELGRASSELSAAKQQISELLTEDQRQKNLELEESIKQIKTTYTSSISVYEDLADLKLLTKNTAKFDSTYAQIVKYLADSNFASASTQLVQLQKDIASEKQIATVVVSPIPAANVPQSNTAPNSGYNRQTVNTDAGSFVVSLIAADLGSTKVIVDTASDGDCANNCPVLSLATYVARSNAFAGVNGSYFCPASYPTCAGKTNSFDLLAMNKNKTYLNSANNVYSSNPAVIFGSGYIRFVGAASQWGRDAGVDGVLSNYPLLLSGSNVVFGGNSDPKQGSKGNRSFVGNKGNTVYIGVVHSATVAEAARALKALGLENALNLDDGGSTALWSGGYKVGPGRDLPNVILFVRK